MRQLLASCPSCGGRLAITRLSCPSCSIDIQGEFAPPSLMRLTSPQLDFIEVFIKNRGVIREVERELGVSYPTVRARLDEVIKALGYPGRTDGEEEARKEDSAETRRREVLAELKAGKISPEQALALLRESPADGDKEDSK